MNDADESYVYKNKIDLLTTIGELYSTYDNPDSAKYYIDKSLKLIDKYDYNDKSRVLRNIGDLYLKNNDIDLALDAYSKGLNNAYELKINSEKLIIHNKISGLYSQKGMSDSMHYHQEKKHIMKTCCLKRKPAQHIVHYRS